VQEDAQNSPSSESELVVWGQSIGAGVATNLAAHQALFSRGVILKTLILETPFLSIRAMLETLYPEKWLPYRYLSPFLRNHLDSWTALGQIQPEAERLLLKPPKVLILKAGRDELVPAEHGDMLEQRCVELGLEVKKQVISGALHTEVLLRSEGRLAVLKAIR
jgi:acetyl esterase/lipase